MSEIAFSKRVKQFIVNHWVSWLIEIIILGVIAGYAIHETRKTAELTREIMRKYDAAVTQFVVEKRQVVGDAVSKSVEVTKESVERAKTVSVENVKNLFEKFRENDKGPEVQGVSEDQGQSNVAE